MSTTALPTDEMLMLAEVLGDVKARTEKLESEFFTQTRPLEAALAGLGALKSHVLDQSLTILAARVEEQREQLAKRIEAAATELIAADGAVLASANKAAGELRTELAAMRQRFGELDTQFAAEVKRVETLARVPGPAGTGMHGAGVYDMERTYQKGDVVSYLGASYVSNVDDNDEKPGPKAKKWTQLVGRPSSYSTGPTEGGGSGEITFVGVPSTATSSGNAGQFAVSAFHLYVCVSTNVWRRIAMGAW